MNQKNMEKWIRGIREETGYSREILENLFHEYQKKSGSLIAKLLFYKRLTQVSLYYGQIQPVFGEKTLKDESLFYDNFCYLQKVIPFSEIDKHLQFLIRPKSENTTYDESTFYFNGLTFSVSGFNFTKEDLRPFWYDNYKIDPRCRLIFSLRYPSPSISYHEELYTNDIALPYFPTIQELIKSKFFINPERIPLNNTIHIALTSLEGNIQEVKEINGEIKVSIGNESDKPLILKIYGENNENPPISLDYTIHKSQELTITEQLTKMDILLLNKDGLALDQRIYNIKQKSSKDEINELILNGENENIEFKREWGTKIPKELKDKRKKTYSELISALANTEGGTILLGVDNNARIIGITKEELDTAYNFIQNINDNTLSPKVTIDMNHVEIDKKIVGVFRVKKSNSIIKNGYDNHFYIRRGSTNRIFESEEITNFRK